MRRRRSDRRHPGGARGSSHTFAAISTRFGSGGRQPPLLDGRPPRGGALGEPVSLELPFRERHQAENALVALAVYAALGLPLDRAHEGASRIELSSLRGEEIALANGGVLINDCWNANPASMHGLPSLSSRSEAAAGSLWSAGWPSWAPRVATTARSASCSPLDHVIAVGGELARGAAFGGVGPGRRRGGEALAELLQPGDVVLVKGSRSVGLEAVAQNLTSNGTSLAAGLLAMLISIVAGPKFIDFLRRNEMGQHIREEGPENPPDQAGDADHGRPAAGLLCDRRVPGAEPLHDRGTGRLRRHARLRRGRLRGRLHRLRHRRSLGLSGRWKLVLLAAITVGLALAVEEVNAPSELYVPVVDWRFGSRSASTSCSS